MPSPEGNAKGRAGRHAVREQDTLADERAVATDLAERLRRALRSQIVVDGSEYVVSASIGIAYAGSSRSGARGHLGGLLQEADVAMNRPKRLIKDRFEVFEHGLRSDLIERGTVKRFSAGHGWRRAETTYARRFRRTVSLPPTSFST